MPCYTRCHARCWRFTETQTQQDAEKVCQRRSPLESILNVAQRLRLRCFLRLRPCLGEGASRRARVGRVRSLVFLSILRECSPRITDVQAIEVLLY